MVVGNNISFYMVHHIGNLMIFNCCRNNKNMNNGLSATLIMRASKISVSITRLIYNTIVQCISSPSEDTVVNIHRMWKR